MNPEIPKDQKPLLAYPIWLSYPDEIKRKLVRLFDIPRTGESVVHVGEMQNGNISGVRKQDGHTPHDLYAINTDRMYDLLNTPADEREASPNFYDLLEEVVSNLDAIYYEQFPEEKPVTAPDTVLIPESAKETAKEVAPIEATEFVPRDPEELIKPKTNETNIADTVRLETPQEENVQQTESKDRPTGTKNKTTRVSKK